MIPIILTVTIIATMAIRIINKNKSNDTNSKVKPKAKNPKDNFNLNNDSDNTNFDNRGNNNNPLGNENRIRHVNKQEIRSFSKAKESCTYGHARRTI